MLISATRSPAHCEACSCTSIVLLKAAFKLEVGTNTFQSASPRRTRVTTRHSRLGPSLFDCHSSQASPPHPRPAHPTNTRPESRGEAAPMPHTRPFRSRHRAKQHVHTTSPNVATLIYTS